MDEARSAAGGRYQLEDAIRRRLSRGCYIFWRLSRGGPFGVWRDQLEDASGWRLLEGGGLKKDFEVARYGCEIS